MKAIQINFVQGRAWVLLWAVVGALAVASVGFLVWSWWHGREQNVVLTKELAAIEQTLKDQALANGAPAVESPRLIDEEQAHALLARDWNPLYDTLEAVDLPGVRLVQISFDAATGQAQVEYELDRIELGASVTAALNAALRPTGQPAGPPIWLLQRLSGGAASSVTGNPGKARGSWAGQL